MNVSAIISDPLNSQAAPASVPAHLRVLYYLFFPGGGIGRYTHELMGRVQELPGISCELVCLPGYEWKDRASYPTWPHLPEIQHRSPVRRRMKFLAAQWRSPRKLLQRARETNADVLHFSNINHLSFPLWRRELDATGAKVAVTVHDVRRAKAMINRRYEVRQLKAFYHRADVLFVHSQAQAADLVSFSGVSSEKVQIVPHGPYDYGPPSAGSSELRQRYGLPGDRRVALAFGQIRDEKNLDVLIRALARQPETHLLIAGRAAGGAHRESSTYLRLAEEVGLSERVTFLDRFIPEAEVPDLFECCDWVALPYSRTFTSQSGVLNVATQYRRPVVLSATATFSEMLAGFDIGVSVEPDNVDGLLAGIEQIEQRLDRGHQHAFDEYLAAFSWEANAQQSRQAYLQLCQPSLTDVACR